MRIPYRLLGAVFVGAASLPLAASAAIFTYTASSGVNNWSTATGWNTTPVSATDTSLLFAPNLASGVVSTSTNNIVGSFQLNSLTFTGTGAGTAPTFTIAGSPLDFRTNNGTAPTMVLTGSGVKPIFEIANNLVLTNTTAVSMNSSGTATLSGTISGAGGLTKNTGNSTLILTNAGNTFTGNLSVSNGTLQVASVGARGATGTGSVGNGSNAGTFNYAGASESTSIPVALAGSTGGASIQSRSGASLTLNTNLSVTNTGGSKSLTLGGAGNLTLQGTIPDGASTTVTVIKSGAGIVTLSSAASSFSGGVTIQQGSLYVSSIGNSGSNSSLGTAGTISMGSTSNSATLRWLGTSDETTNKVFAMTGTTGGLTLTATGAVLTVTSGLSVVGAGNKTLTLASSGGNCGFNFNGLIADGAGSVISVRFNGSGSGANSLGNASNTFSGGVTIDGNTANKTTTVSVASIGTTGSASPLGTSGNIKLGSTTATSINSLTYTGAGETTDKVIDLAGTVGEARLVQNGSGTLTLSSNLTASGVGAKLLTLSGSGAGRIAGAIVDSSAGTTSVTKSGSGTWTFSGVSTYTGTTTVNAGGLVLNGSLAVGSNLSVAAAAWLAGSGTAPGTVTVSGTLSPGNSPGVITLGSLVLTSTSVTAIEVASAGTRGTNYDGVSILNASGLTYGGTMSFAFGGSAIAPNTTLDIFSFTGTPSGGFDTLVSTGFYAGTWTNNNNGTLTLIKDSDTLTFSENTGDVIVVPEPAVTLVGMAGLVGALAVRRRRLTRAGTSDAP